MKEWYMEEYEEKTYLHNKELVVQRFPDIDGEHDHCELCWNRFSKYPGDLHEGYYEPDSKSWICGECFKQFHELFGWTIGTATQKTD